MTLAFVTHFKEHHGCRQCLAIPGKRMCGGCRAKALAHWHRYVGQRLKVRLCIQCPRKHKPGEQRCARCAEENRVRCLAWTRVNYSTRAKRMTELGLCHCCSRPADGGQWNCRKCRSRKSELARGVVVPMKKPYRCLEYQSA